MITEFITYLQGAGLTPTVKFAFTTEPVEDYEEEFPVIMVYPEGESPEASDADNFVIQNVTKGVVCMLGCAIADYEVLLAELRGAAMGWVFEYHDAMEMAGAQIIGIKGGYIWWRETYATEVRIRQST